MSRPLLQFVELGGYPDLGPLFRSLGFEPVVLANARKMQAELRRNPPAALVAEFNHQTEFRDRTSALESLLALAQQYPAMRVVVLYRSEQQSELERLARRFPGRFAAIALPIDEARLAGALES